MYDLQQNDELLIQETSNALQQDLIEISNSLTGSTRKRRRKSNEENKDEQMSVKKIMHRETERQRRQEMSGLYASLRSLLPLEYIKGKRSVSDHMHEAVNYIKHMEMNIKDLQLHLDKLKKSIAPNSYGCQSNENWNTTYYSPNHVTINRCNHNLEVLIDVGVKEKLGFPISIVLMELLQTGLDIISCASSKCNDRFFYRIQSDVCDLTYVDLSELQQRLENVMKISG